MNIQVKPYEQDDGRVIANMNVEGMPWYTPAQPEATGSGMMLSKQEARIAMWGALRAGLTIAAVFSAAMVLFTLFCTHVWLR